MKSGNFWHLKKLKIYKGSITAQILSCGELFPDQSRWEKMSPGDVVLVYNDGRIRFAGEIAAKVRNKELARYFWNDDDSGSTWELMYFIVNEERTDVPIEKLNPLFGYQSNYRPQGFSMINEEAVLSFAQNYGDIL